VCACLCAVRRCCCCDRRQATSPQDERMLEALARGGDGVLRIVDCRPRANAMANMAAGEY
jgi:hypothetical protein